MFVRVLPYDPRWPVRFDQKRAVLERLLAPWLSAGVHHIGSTSVPGLAAKPVIDMIAGVDDLAAAEAAVPVLEGRGWVHAFHRPRALWFHKGTAERPTHALHPTEPALTEGSGRWVPGPVWVGSGWGGRRSGGVRRCRRGARGRSGGPRPGPG